MTGSRVTARYFAVRRAASANVLSKYSVDVPGIFAPCTAPRKVIARVLLTSSTRDVTGTRRDSPSTLLRTTSSATPPKRFPTTCFATVGRSRTETAERISCDMSCALAERVMLTKSHGHACWR